MRADGVISSSVNVEASHIMECTLWVNEAQPVGEQDATMRIDASNPVPVAWPAEGTSAFAVSLSIAAEFCDVDGAKTPRAKLGIKVRGTVSYADGAVSDISAEGRRLAVSVLYPQAQAYLTMLTGASPMGSPRLPTLDSSAVMKALDASASA